MAFKYKLFLILSLLFVLLLLLFFSNTTYKLLCSNKIWAHRINNFNDFKKVKDKVKGIETDVIFYPKENKFYVQHDKESLSETTLESFLAKLNKSNNHLCWIDFKNLSKANSEKSLKKITYILEKDNIEKDRLIIESKNFYGLNKFSENGYITSYYMPSDLYLTDSVNLHKKLKNINSKLSITNAKYISSTYKNYGILKSNFPDYDKLYWFTSYGKYSKLKTRIILFKICFNNKVDVILMPFK